MFRRVYFDNSATTAIDERVLEAMMPYLTDNYGNASSIHFFGQQTRSAVDKARHQVAAAVNARPNEIVFTSGGTESNNLAIRGLVEMLPQPSLATLPERHIVTSTIEHPAVREVCADLEKRGVAVTYLPVYENGIVRVDDVRQAIRENTVLISVMTANNEIGTLQPVAEIGRLVRGLRDSGRRIWFHTDAVQAVGKVKVDVEEMGCDLLSLSGHKFHAPKGIGALYIRRGTRLRPQHVGGRQERGLRGGTEPVAQIVGLGRAAELAADELTERAVRVGAMRDRLEHFVLENIDGSVLNGDAHDRLTNISNISFREIEGEGLLINLDMHGIAVSTGSACSSGSLEPSPVIRSLGRSDDLARGAIRFSLSKDNTDDDIELVLATLPSAVESVRKLLPGFKSSAET
ncbi:MAG TPA: cysteine desulfurase family protein [Pyrinomonadaceae bacterium]|nr:cysteine desulfurase [Chloracidobacterium sp.]HBE83396.1 cysteine desulfurase NifS [Blastocatellia bacterium]HRJ89160.1 cysteine desulfurase family protein [Pyrinomonadaceae bacterium]HRK50129.1 cysteine desulfurase family protein [Pyrinomonadaceae bacterium]